MHDRTGNSPPRGPFCVAWACRLLATLWFGCQAPVWGEDSPTIRWATFNTSLFRDAPGQLREDLVRGDDLQAKKIAEIIQRVRPDVLLVNEFDYDETGQAAAAFQRNYLQVGQHGQRPISFPHRFTAAVNTGVASGLDLDADGSRTGPGDAFGFGRFAGQYGMLVLSRLPLAKDQIRTFQTFLWQDMPQAQIPRDPETGQPYYPAKSRAALRLPSKSMWDLPFKVGSRTVHLIVSHPTPPVFDGPEDRNGLRNHDEIRLLADYLDPSRSGYIYDDVGLRGGLQAGDLFVVAGDMNSDPLDGDSHRAAIRQLLEHPLIQQGNIPASRGAVEKSVADGGANSAHRGDPAHDTTDFNNDETAGNLRLDYVLPSRSLQVVESGVFWPPAGDAGAAAISASDHRLVWIDIRLPGDGVE